VHFFNEFTLGIRTKDLHNKLIVHSKRPVVVPIEFPQPKTIDLPLASQTESPRTATDIQSFSMFANSLQTSAFNQAALCIYATYKKQTGLPS